ncbi:hypothetical protein TruAng_008969 [Truncatella angustata]|nr:hypothetical protein TruAng_008969 [Truncatella angustata]
MTSLHLIMDMNVDKEESQANKRDGPSSTPNTRRNRDFSASDYNNPEEQQETLSTSTKQRRVAPGRNSKSSTTVAAGSSTTVPSSSSTARPVPARGTSNTSNEEMHRYGSHASGSGSGGGEQPNRPMGNVPGEVPIKLTPITGRVSRAKKGQPVHTCEICRPPKTFTRAEHLSEQEGSSRDTTGDNSRRTSTTSVSGSYDMGQGRTSSQGPMSQQHDVTSNPGSNYGGNTPYHQYNTGGGPPMSPPQPPGRRESYTSNSSGPAGGYTHTPQIAINQPPNMEDSPGGMSYEHLANFQSPRTTPHNGLLIVTTGLGVEAPGLLAPDHSPWASSESNFSTPSDNSRRRLHMPDYSSPTSGAEWAVNSYVTAYTPTSQDIHSPHMDVMTTSAPYFHNPWGTPSYSTSIMDPSMPSYSEDYHYFSHPQSHFPSVRSPTPPNNSSSVQSAESLVTIAPAPPQVVGGRFKGQAAPMVNFSGAAFLTAVTLPKAARDAIPHLLEVYWKRFDNLFPLVHRRKFELAPDELLRTAMAAVGSQFLEGREDRVRGNQLHEWAWQEVKRQSQILQWNVSTMQTILLCEIFARFRGKKVAIKPSEPFRSLYSRVDTITHPDPDTSFGSTTSTRGPTAVTAAARWAQWIEEEARRRLLAACFVLDVHTSVYYDLPLSQRFVKPCPPIPLIAASERLWNATPKEWETLISAQPATLEPVVLSEDIISQDRIARSPALDQAVFLASEALRIPTWSVEFTDLTESPDLRHVDRILTLFPGSGVGYTYAALHFTPLHDLLAVSGDSWLFSQKVLEGKAFVQHQKTLKQWSGSLHAATATRFAAQALVAFLTTNDNDTMFSSDSKRKWNMADISDYWAIYVCALICWALGHRGTNTTTSISGPSSSRGGGNNNDNDNANYTEREGEIEALGWLHLVGGLANPQDVVSHVSLHGRSVIIGVVAMVRRRLEGEALGTRNRLLVDAVGVLKKLEEGMNWKWF